MATELTCASTCSYLSRILSFFTSVDCTCPTDLRSSWEGGREGGREGRREGGNEEDIYFKWVNMIT